MQLRAGNAAHGHGRFKLYGVTLESAAAEALEGLFVDERPGRQINFAAL